MAFEASRGRRHGVVSQADESAPQSVPGAPLVAFSIDSFADASLSRERDEAGRSNLRCDGCDEKIEGEPAGRGLFLTTRGTEVRYEEPVLCAHCATVIGLRAGLDLEIEDGEG